MAWVVAAHAAQPARYDGDRVVRVEVADEAQLETILNLTDDVWSHEFGAPGEIEVRLSPAQFAALEGLGLSYEVMIEDVQAAIDEQLTPAGRGTFDQFLRLSQVRDHMAALAAGRPDLAQRINIGPSLQNRPLEVLRITGPGDSSQRPLVWLQGCQHAREWITVMVTLYLADRLVNTYDSDPGVRALLDRAVVCVIPVVNPDGYEYSWNAARLHRKNMRNNGNGTLGVDLNRNWSVAWGLSNGSSGDPGSETYRGPAPFSEPETTAVRNYLATQSRVAAFLDIHSFSQLILWPWAHQTRRSPDNERQAEIWYDVCREIVDELGAYYIANQGNQGLYPAAGTAVDWGYGTYNVPAATFELRDRGDFGFLVPPTQIQPNCEEIWPGVLRLLSETTQPLRLRPMPVAPAFAAPNSTLELTVRIRSARAGLSVGSVQLAYRTDNGQPAVVPMSPGGCVDCWTATIPSGPCGTTLGLSVSATRSDGAVAHWPDRAFQPELQVPVRSATIVSLADFNTSNGGFAVSGANSAGRWVRGTPQATFTATGQAEPSGGYPLGSGGACWVTGVSTTTDPEQSDIDGPPTEIVSTLYNIAGLSDPVVQFPYWLYSDGNEVLAAVSFGTPPNPKPLPALPALGRWAVAQFRVRDWVPTGDIARFGFFVSGYLPGTVTEAAIDDFALLDLSCPPLPGDMNCDGFVTVSDIGGFVLALTDPAQYAVVYPSCELARGDVNGDGFVTVADIGVFVGLLTMR
ncbi:MAG: M14 family zinc carboxypeptidase [Phycisphaerae bacterium]|nr:M14 family zinc carboxypeptidase [Phycisphaerae bacterium]